MPRRKKCSNENLSRSSLSINKDKPQQRYAANARERARMRVLSRAFCRLKTTLPWVPADTKLSKLDTLRLAASYIAHLKGILQEETLGSSESSLHPAMSMTWPFGFNRPLGGSPEGGSHDGGSLVGSEDDDEDDDGESISSCTWEEVTPTAKDCIHLDGRRSSSGGGRARGKGNNNNNSQNSEDKESPSSQLSTKSSATNHGCLNSNTIIGNTSRPLSQTQQHHFRNSGAMYHPQTDKLSSGMMTGTNLENAPPPPPPSTSHQDEILGVGVSPNPGNIDLFGADMNSGSSATYTSQHNYHHHHQHQNHISDNQSLLHHLVPSSPFGFSNDLISIG